MLAPNSSVTSIPLTTWDTVPTALELPLLSASSMAQQQSTVIVAQFESDVLGDIGGAFKNFYESGQIWALIIGIVIGYVVRGITTYK